MNFSEYYSLYEEMDSALSMLESLKTETVYSIKDIEYWVTSYEKLYMKGIKHFLEYYYDNDIKGNSYVVWQEPDTLPNSAHSFFNIYRSLSKASEDFLKEPYFEKIMKEYEEIHSFDDRLRKVWVKAYKDEGWEVYFEYHELTRSKYGLEDIKSLIPKNTFPYDVDIDIREFKYRYLFCETVMELLDEFGDKPP